MIVTDEMVNRFLAWPLPESVCSDLIVTRSGVRNRLGTMLLTATEAEAMLRHVLATASIPTGVPEPKVDHVFPLYPDARQEAHEISTQSLDPNRPRPECPMGSKPCGNPLCAVRCNLLDEPEADPFDCRAFHELCMDYRGAQYPNGPQEAYERLQAYCRHVAGSRHQRYSKTEGAE
jgi:hypothetical protein